MRVQGSEFRVQGAGFRVQGVGFRVQGSVFRVQGSGFGVPGSGFRVQGSGFRVQSSRSTVQGLRFRVQGLRSTVQGLSFRVQSVGLKVQWYDLGSGFRVEDLVRAVSTQLSFTSEACAFSPLSSLGLILSRPTACPTCGLPDNGVCDAVVMSAMPLDTERRISSPAGAPTAVSITDTADWL